MELALSELDHCCLTSVFCNIPLGELELIICCGDFPCCVININHEVENGLVLCGKYLLLKNQMLELLLPCHSGWMQQKLIETIIDIFQDHMSFH